MATIIIKSDGQGIARKSGTSDNGSVSWIDFVIDYMAEQTEGECCECGKVIDGHGWLCLDGGEQACDDCVDFRA
jgi:hypothetical protein